MEAYRTWVKFLKTAGFVNERNANEFRVNNDFTAIYFDFLFLRVLLVLFLCSSL